MIPRSYYFDHTLLTDMKIKKINTYLLKPKLIFLEVQTDEGISGWGELIAGARAQTVNQAAHEIGDRIIGLDPMKIEDIWQSLYHVFFRGGAVHMTVVSGIETALWDIKGKFLGAPVYQLLGGAAREKIMIYSWIEGDCSANIAKAALNRKAQGFKAVKILATEEMHYIDSFKKVQFVLERVQAIRDAVGYDMEIGIDFHGRVHQAMAKILARELETFHPMFIEEPLPPENLDGLKELRNITTIPIALGERLFTRWAFTNVLSKRIVDIVQPDVALTGGILEMRKICAMAEAFDVAVAPHAPYGPVALAATFQVDACSPNVFIQEQSQQMQYYDGFNLLDYVKNKDIFNYKDGFAVIPDGEGLGIEIDKDVVVQNAQGKLDARNPEWRNYDGTVTNW